MTAHSINQGISSMNAVRSVMHDDRARGLRYVGPCHVVLFGREESLQVSSFPREVIGRLCVRSFVMACDGPAPSFAHANVRHIGLTSFNFCLEM